MRGEGRGLFSVRACSRGYNSVRNTTKNRYTFRTVRLRLFRVIPTDLHGLKEVMRVRTWRSSPISRTTEGHQLNAGVLLSSIARIQLCLQEESLGGTTINRKDQAMSGRRVRTNTVSATSVASTIPRPMSPEPVMENVM
ncbi:Uncharacterised protein [Chlamydia trachomatis]|nr:Uncharacterised protein [Chlamydia trachomatis]CRH91710.1 Uncharacterised protein [Chlamydia trachomatis]